MQLTANLKQRLGFTPLSIEYNNPDAPENAAAIAELHNSTTWQYYWKA
jgi:hypothetical protein